MTTDFGNYFDEVVLKSKGERDSIYYRKSIEHIENIKTIFQLFGKDKNIVVLDAGCGIGNFLVPLSKKCKFIHGIDISEESIKICEKRIKEENLQNIFVQVAYLTNLPFADHSIDKVICFGVLHYLDYIEIEKVIVEFKRVLNHNGTLIIGFINGASPFGVTTKIVRYIRKLIKGKKKYPGSYISFKKLKRIIECRAGNVKLYHSGYFYPVMFPSKLIEWIGNRFYYEKYLPRFVKKFGMSLTISVQFTH